MLLLLATFAIAFFFPLISSLVPVSSIDVAAFIFDPWTPSPLVYDSHGKNWTEWELVRHALPRFPGHQQPHVSLWGEIDTGLSSTWDMLNAEALDHGINVYLWDFYWWQDSPQNPLLVRGLEAFLASQSSSTMKFALMWANQDWNDRFPAKRLQVPAPLFHGKMDAPTFATMTTYWIQNYLHLPNYYTVPNPQNASVRCPLINIYLLDKLVEGLGGLPAAVAAFSSFRTSAANAGISCLHIQADGVGVRSATGKAALTSLNIGSVTDYCWQHFQGMPDFPLTEYAPYAAASLARLPELKAEVAPLPYVPNFSVAWDPSPRTVQSDAYDNWGYPSTPVLQPTPLEIQIALNNTAQAVATGCDPSWCMLTVYAYTEFSEGGSLFPTVLDGYGRLNAFKAVFGARS
jgi:hypothetical protein